MKPRYLIAVYILIAFLTAAYVHEHRKPEHQYGRLSRDIEGGHNTMSLFAGAGWPAYWAWRVSVVIVNIEIDVPDGAMPLSHPPRESFEQWNQKMLDIYE